MSPEDILRDSLVVAAGADLHYISLNLLAILIVLGFIAGILISRRIS